MSVCVYVCYNKHAANICGNEYLLSIETIVKLCVTDDRHTLKM